MTSPARERTVGDDAAMNAPRLYLHPDGKTLSIGFEGTPDTLLSLESGAARYSERDRDRGDMKSLREWVAAVQATLVKHHPLIGTSWRRPNPAGGYFYIYVVAVRDGWIKYVGDDAAEHPISQWPDPYERVPDEE